MSESNLGEPRPSANRRYVAALAATIAFSGPAFIAIQVFNQRPSYNHFYNAFVGVLNLFDYWAWVLVVLAVSVFAIAAPIENRFGSRFPTWKIALIYLAGFSTFGAVMAVFIFVTTYPTNSAFIVLVMFGVVGAAVSSVSRLIYPMMLRMRRTSISLVVIASSIALAGWLIPNQSPTGIGAVAYFPNITQGELARTTFLNGADPVTPGMKSFTSLKGSLPGQKYDLVVSCDSVKSPASFVVTAIDLKTKQVIKEEAFECPADPGDGEGGKSEIGEIKFQRAGTRVRLNLTVKNGEKAGTLPLAFAAVAKTGLPW